MRAGGRCLPVRHRREGRARGAGTRAGKTQPRKGALCADSTPLPQGPRNTGKAKQAPGAGYCPRDPLWSSTGRTQWLCVSGPGQPVPPTAGKEVAGGRHLPDSTLSVGLRLLSRADRSATGDTRLWTSFRVGESSLQVSSGHLAELLDTERATLASVPRRSWEVHLKTLLRHFSVKNEALRRSPGRRWKGLGAWPAHLQSVTRTDAGSRHGPIVLTFRAKMATTTASRATDPATIARMSLSV